MTDSAEIVGSLDDLLMQIWVRLPGTSLMRFKLVSKKWKCLITSPEFSHLRHPYPNPTVGLICPAGIGDEHKYIRLDAKVPVGQPPPEILQFPDDHFGSYVHQSCNGLLLCCNSQNIIKDTVFGNGYLRIESWFPTHRFRCYIYNPTTNCFTKLPTPGVVQGVPKLVYGISFALDRTNWNTYQVVCVRESDLDPKLFQIEIYSRESGAWRVSGEPFRSTVEFSYGVYWNSSIHWISFKPRELLYFNIKEEKFHKVDVPDEKEAPDPTGIRRSVLLESCDHLHMIELYHDKVMFNVYEMKRDYSAWFVKYRVDLTQVTSAFRDTTAVVQMFSILSLVRRKGGSYLVLHLNPKVVRFNLKTHVFEEICDLDVPLLGFRSPPSAQHIESLASV